MSSRLVACLICVASALAASVANAESGPAIVKGPYLQALGSTSVEIRAELDVPDSVSVSVSPVAAGADAASPRVIRDPAVRAMHVVRIDGLEPSTRYSYSLAVEAGEGAAATASKGELTTAPRAGSSGAPSSFSFLLYGDNRTDEPAHAAIVHAMIESPSDFLVNTGDLVEDGASAANWQSFFATEAPLLRDRDVFSCVGNHEITDGAGANYLRYFGPTSDARGEGEKPRLYGSFRWGNARFFLLDAMDAFDSAPQRGWLNDELARADSEAGLVWRIVVMHHAPWSSGPHGGNARALRAGIPALLASHHVDLVFGGHDHIYERGYAAGLRYLISGGGGAPLYEIDKLLPSARKAESVHHFIEATVSADALKLVAKRSDGSVLERCGVTKGREGWDCDPAVALPQHRGEPSPSSAPAVAGTRCGCEVAGTTTRGSLAPAGAALVALCAGGRRVRRRRATKARAPRDAD